MWGHLFATVIFVILVAVRDCQLQHAGGAGMPGANPMMGGQTFGMSNQPMASSPVNGNSRCPPIGGNMAMSGAPGMQAGRNPMMNPLGGMQQQRPNMFGANQMRPQGMGMGGMPDGMMGGQSMGMGGMQSGMMGGQGMGMGGMQNGMMGGQGMGMGGMQNGMMGGQGMGMGGMQNGMMGGQGMGMGGMQSGMMGGQGMGMGGMQNGMMGGQGMGMGGMQSGMQSGMMGSQGMGMGGMQNGMMGGQDMGMGGMQSGMMGSQGMGMGGMQGKRKRRDTTFGNNEPDVITLVDDLDGLVDPLSEELVEEVPKGIASQSPVIAQQPFASATTPPAAGSIRRQTGSLPNGQQSILPGRQPPSGVPARQPQGAMPVRQPPPGVPVRQPQGSVPIEQPHSTGSVRTPQAVEPAELDEMDEMYEMDVEMDTLTGELGEGFTTEVVDDEKAPISTDQQPTMQEPNIAEFDSSSGQAKSAGGKMRCTSDIQCPLDPLSGQKMICCPSSSIQHVCTPPAQGGMAGMTSSFASRPNGMGQPGLGMNPMQQGMGQMQPGSPGGGGFGATYPGQQMVGSPMGGSMGAGNPSQGYGMPGAGMMG